MNINLHIEQLVLDDLAAPGNHGAIIQAAVETELRRLLAEAGLSRMTGGSLRQISGGQIQLMMENNPAQTGHQIAHAVHAAMTTHQAAPRQSGNHRGGKR